MKPFQITLINSLILMTAGLWGYFGSDNPSFTALIPVVSGIILFVFAFAMKNSGRVIAHLAVLLTLLLLVALIKPLTASISRNDPAAVTRVIVMMGTCTIALIVYVKSFINARKQRSRI